MVCRDAYTLAACFNSLPHRIQDLELPELQTDETPNKYAADVPKIAFHTGFQWILLLLTKTHLGDCMHAESHSIASHPTCLQPSIVLLELQRFCCLLF